jgi:hypothetical protein
MTSHRPDGKTADEIRETYRRIIAANVKRSKRAARRNKEAAAGGWTR